MLRLREGVWTVAVQHEHEPATFIAIGVLREGEDAPNLSGGSEPPPSRAVVELAAATGGMRPRALIGGQFVARSGERLALEVQHSGALGLGVPAECPSLASGRPLVAGLPLEFAEAVVDGLVRVTCQNSLPSGVLVVDRAAHDEVDSSQFVFEKAAGILRCVLAMTYQGAMLDEDELRRLLV